MDYDQLLLNPLYRQVCCQTLCPGIRGGLQRVAESRRSDCPANVDRDITCRIRFLLSKVRPIKGSICHGPGLESDDRSYCPLLASILFHMVGPTHSSLDKPSSLSAVPSQFLKCIEFESLTQMSSV